jgi:hypothetical protein
MSRFNAKGGDDANLPPHGAVPALAPRLPCRNCAEPTLTATLSQYGALCFTCYEACCAEGSTQRPVKRLTDKEKAAVRSKFASLAGLSPDTVGRP